MPTSCRSAQPLADAIAGLAETPDHSSGVDARLAGIARLSVDRVDAADYASVTALRGRQNTTVAATDELTLAVEQAQFADEAGPCLTALRTGRPVAVPDTAATMEWPGFHEVAPGLGLRSTVSLPLYMARGVPVAVLNLYGRDHDAMAPLIIGVAQLYGGDHELRTDLPALPVTDPGAEELLTGYARAIAARATIQLAIDVLAAELTCARDDAYAALCMRTAAGGSLADAASDVVRQRH